jgi:hypothetical protein
MSLTQMDRAFIENFSKYSRTLSKSTQGGEYSVSIKVTASKNHAVKNAVKQRTTTRY